MSRSKIVYQPVAERAAGGEVNEGAPLIRHQRIEGPVVGAPEPHVPIEAGRRGGIRQIAVALASRRRALKGVAEGDVAHRARGHQFRGLLEVAAGSLHGARLHYAIILARRLDHFQAFVDALAGGLLHVDILAGLAGFHRHVGVPVVGRSDANRVDGAVRDHLAKVLNGLHREAAFLSGVYGAVEMWLVNIAYRDGLHFRHPHGV